MILCQHLALLTAFEDNFVLAETILEQYWLITQQYLSPPLLQLAFSCLVWFLCISGTVWLFRPKSPEMRFFLPVAS